MKSKKAQEGIIVTVLLVLVAIAAVGAVAYFIINNVKGGTNAAADKTDCLKVQLSIDKAIPGAVTYSRGSDSVIVRGVNIYVNGKLNVTGITLNVLESGTSSITGLKIGDAVRVNPVLNSSGLPCESGAEATVVAA